MQFHWARMSHALFNQRQMFNTTCLSNTTSTVVNTFAQVWVESLEFRVAVFVMVLQCSFMLWAASVVREIMRTSTTVLCKLLVYASAASNERSNRNARSVTLPSAARTVHKTDGGPPPGLPPDLPSVPQA